MIEFSNFWQSHEVGKHQTMQLDLGPLRVRVHRGQREWYVSHEKMDEGTGPCSLSITDSPLDRSFEWTRWIFDSAIDKVELRPALPDRAIIVRPEMPMSLMPRQEILFFVELPVNLVLMAGKKHEEVIEIPTMVLSNSWFGSFSEGELCYALKTTAKMHLDELVPRPNRAIFPLEVRNVSSQQLNFERLCLRPQHLNVYSGASRLWTNRGRVSYRGETNWSRIVYTSSPPGIDRDEIKLTKSRENIQRGGLMKTFDTLKQKVELL